MFIPSTGGGRVGSRRISSGPSTEQRKKILGLLRGCEEIDSAEGAEEH